MMKFHHTGIAVKSIAESVKIYSQIFGEESVSPIYNISSQKVNVCFVKISDEAYLELVEPTDPESTINKLIEKGITYYHAGYKVQNIEEVIENLQEIEDEGEIYESIEDIWPDYPSKDDFFFNEDEY